MFDWTEISRDPIAAEVRRGIAEELRSRQRPRCFDKHTLVEDFVRDRSVLDVGVVAHAIEYVDSSEWMHGKIRRWAREVVGVDILESEVEELRRRGLDVRAVDATSDVDLGQRFERVVMGDLIEHVSDPVALLRFGARHLVPGGRILATTPNPFYFAWLYDSLRHGVHVANAEHVAWIGPTNALEIARRAGVVFAEYRLIQTPFAQGAGALRLLYGVRDALFREQEIFGHTYAFVFERGAV